MAYSRVVGHPEADPLPSPSQKHGCSLHVHSGLDCKGMRVASFTNEIFTTE